MTGEILAIDKTEPSAAGSARGSSFYAAMRMMPPAQREAMYEIYHFCRAIDDIADEAGERVSKLEVLNNWRRDIGTLYASDTPVSLTGLAKAVHAFNLQQADFLAVIDGMEMDVNGPICAPDFATLLLYCDRVASAVGRLSVRVFGMGEEDGLLLAEHLGLALQLTNILRDIDEDAAIGRLYLPKELLTDAGILIGKPAEVIANPAISSVCHQLSEKALSHFTEADSIMKRSERKQVRTPRVMSEAYHAILTALTERGFTAPRAPVHVSKMKLGYILVRNILF